jgi:hypothetical protein
MRGGLSGIGGGGQGSGYIQATPTAQFWYYSNNTIYATAGNVNTGGGGGGGAWDGLSPAATPTQIEANFRGAGPGMSGGSGIVIIRYPYE